MTRIRPFAALAALALIVAACGGGGDDTSDSTAVDTTTSTSTTTTVKPTTTTSSSTTTTTVPVTIRQPLTGAPLESEDQIVQRAAMVVKIDNNGNAVPNHSGLGVADIVFEEVVEGRTTRFAAVFHSQSSDPIGPIRSGRTQDIDLFTSYNYPLFVWSGGNANVTRAIDDSTLVNMGPNHASGYFRGPGRAPHNLYNSTDNIWAQTPALQPGPPPQQFEYLEADESFDGTATSGARFPVGGENIEWTWNAERGAFERSQRGRPHDDRLTGRIGATNVVVMGVDYQPSPADRRSPEAQTVGEGPVYVFSDGKVTGGVWRRGANTEPIGFFTLDGEPIALNPGNTWVELAEQVFVDDVALVQVEVLEPA
jgi:hypothetical protein